MILVKRPIIDVTTLYVTYLFILGWESNKPCNSFKYSRKVMEEQHLILFNATYNQKSLFSSKQNKQICFLSNWFYNKQWPIKGQEKACLLLLNFSQGVKEWNYRSHVAFLGRWKVLQCSSLTRMGECSLFFKNKRFPLHYLSQGRVCNLSWF